MLKSLISLFAEKFLQSKSEWVGGQAYPSRRVSLSTSLTEYVPPADGYFGFYKPVTSSDNSIDVYAYGTDSNIISRNTLMLTLSSSNIYYSGVIPVKKGYRVTVSGTFAELWFSPAVGSKS